MKRIVFIMVFGLLFGIALIFRGEILQLFLNQQYFESISLWEEFPVDTPYLILDNRSYEEFSVSHLPNAKWADNLRFDVKSLDTLSREMPILVYCTVGIRSQEIALRLQEAGFKNVYNLKHGIYGWVKNGNSLQNIQNETTHLIHPYNPFWAFWMAGVPKSYQP